LSIDKPWQIGVFADACNECGNCDVFCPEDGAPYLSKPILFGSVGGWKDAPRRDGFAFEMLPTGVRMHGRFNGRAISVESGEGELRYRGHDFDVQLDLADPAGTAKGIAAHPVDLTPLRIMEQIRIALPAPEAINFLSVILSKDRSASLKNMRSQPWPT
jgi:putative selenate reductase